MVKLGYSCELQNGRDPPVYFRFTVLFFYSKGDVWKHWRESGKVAEVDIPPARNSTKPCPLHTPAPLPPQEETYFPSVFLIQLQVEDRWNLYSTVWTLLLSYGRNQAHQTEVSLTTLNARLTIAEFSDLGSGRRNAVWNTHSQKSERGFLPRSQNRKLPCRLQRWFEKERKIRFDSELSLLGIMYL